MSVCMVMMIHRLSVTVMPVLTHQEAALQGHWFIHLCSLCSITLVRDLAVKTITTSNMQKVLQQLRNFLSSNATRIFYKCIKEFLI